MSWRVGLSTGAFYQLPIMSVLPAIRQAGFSHLEICSHKAHLNCADSQAVRQVGSTLRQLGLQVFSLHAPFSPSIDIASLDEGVRATSVAETLDAVQALRELDGRTLVIHPGGQTPPEEAARPQLLLRALDSLRTIRARCAELGLIMAIEDMLPHLLGGRTEEILWLADRLPSEGVGLCLDTGHAQLARRLANRLAAFAPLLVVVHASDNHGERDDHLPPGRGQIDWHNLVAGLFRSRFDGALLLETTASGSVKSHLSDLQSSASLIAPPSTA